MAIPANETPPGTPQKESKRQASKNPGMPKRLSMGLFKRPSFIISSAKSQQAKLDEANEAVHSAREEAAETERDMLKKREEAAAAEKEAQTLEAEAAAAEVEAAAAEAQRVAAESIQKAARDRKAKAEEKKAKAEVEASQKAAAESIQRAAAKRAAAKQAAVQAAAAAAATELATAAAAEAATVASELSAEVRKASCVSWLSQYGLLLVFLAYSMALLANWCWNSSAEPTAGLAAEIVEVAGVKKGPLQLLKGLVNLVKKSPPKVVIG